MPTSLPISRLINVSVSLTPTAAQQQNLSTLLVLGSTDVIDVVTRMRTYSTLTQVSADFGTSAPEYLAAQLWFAQQPQPTNLLIGRWAKTATKGRLICGTLSAANTLIATWNAITTGSLKVTIDGGSQSSLTALSFAASGNLNAVAAVITAALTGATCVYNAVFNRFEFISNSTGATSTVSFLSAGASGVDISGLLAGLVTSSGAYQANGIALETALTAATLFDLNFGQQWYALQMPEAVDADHQAVAAFIEATTAYHLYGVTTQAAGVLSSASTTDIAFLLNASGYKRTVVQYSSTSAYAIASLLGRILTVDYTGNNTALTLMYKTEPSVTAEQLNTTQITTVETKSCNIFVAYNNATSIIEPAKCASGDYIDTVIGSAAFAVALQTAGFNLLFTSTTKIPQTDAGTHQLIAAFEAVCIQFVQDGWLAPGTWTGQNLGTLNTNDFMPKGYYIFAPPVATQSASARAARVSVPIQIAAKLAGAVHTVNLAVTVNQ